MSDGDRFDNRISTDNTLIAKFIDYHRLRGLSEATVKRREWTLTHFAALVPLAEATHDDVEAFLASKGAPASRRAYLGDLRALYKWASRRDLLSSDPTLAVDTPKVPKRAPTPLSRDELRRAWEHADYELRVIIALGARAGLRVSEMANLDASDVDHDRGVLVVRGGKGGKDRVLPMSGALASLLEHSGPGPVVKQRRTGDSISAAVRRHFRPLGITKRAHDLRATFATEVAARSGGNIMLVQHLLGHADPSTAQRYMAYVPDGRDVVETLFDDDVVALAGVGHC